MRPKFPQVLSARFARISLRFSGNKDVGLEDENRSQKIICIVQHHSAGVGGYILLLCVTTLLLADPDCCISVTPAVRETHNPWGYCKLWISGTVDGAI